MLQQLKNIYHLFVAFLANCLYRFPSKGLTVIGITGTDGKTTTASLIYHILKKNGKRVALISTVGATINGKEYKTGFHVTTPGSFALQSYLRIAKEAGVTIVILEVTSHALDQNRVFGIPFTIGVITNVTHEHLDYHKSYDEYLAAKVRLLDRSKIGVVNKDDSSFEHIANGKWQMVNSRLLTFGKKNADVTFRDIASWKKKPVGDFNQYNTLAALAVCNELGISSEAVKKAVADFQLPKGRFEVVYDNDFTVIIDFAHTPNALENLLKTLEKMKAGGRIILVFGCAGERDRTKRPLMGEVASRFAQSIILTAEDSRSESVLLIMDEIAKGVLSVGEVPEMDKIADRQEAISFAIAKARKNDVVVITGKGHEESMNLGNGETPWSDHKAVEKALEKRHEK